MAEISVSLQQGLVTLLVHSEREGGIVANLLDPKLCEGEYQIIAERAVKYWKQYRKPPADHMDDELSDILEDREDKRAPTFRRLLGSMSELSQTINAKYILDRLRTFTRMQTIKATILSSAEALSQREEMALDEVEAELGKIIKAREAGFTPGMRLSDFNRVVEYMEKRAREFDFGIEVLDRRYIVPERGTATVILAPAGVGKSWLLINAGKRALRQRKKVLHLTLEMSEELVTMRYYQSLLAIPRRKMQGLTAPVVELENKKIIGVSSEEIEPAFAMDSAFLAEELNQRFTQWPSFNPDDLIVKQFPPHKFSMEMLESYLDQLEAEGFIPDELIADYLGLFKIDIKNPRISMGQNMVAFRGICVERNMAGIIAQQTGRASDDAQLVQRGDVAEDWSIIGTADNVLTLTRTRTERSLGLARIAVEKARSEEDRFIVLITQALPIGQFCLSSYYIGPSYIKLLKAMTKDLEDGAAEVEASEDEE